MLLKNTSWERSPARGGVLYVAGMVEIIKLFFSPPLNKKQTMACGCGVSTCGGCGYYGGYPYGYYGAYYGPYYGGACGPCGPVCAPACGPCGPYYGGYCAGYSPYYRRC